MISGHVFMYLTSYKGKIFDGVFLRKVSGPFYKQNTIDNCFAMKELCQNFT